MRPDPRRPVPHVPGEASDLGVVLEHDVDGDAQPIGIAEDLVVERGRAHVAKDPGCEGDGALLVSPREEFEGVVEHLGAVRVEATTNELDLYGGDLGPRGIAGVLGEEGRDRRM